MAVPGAAPQVTRYSPTPGAAKAVHLSPKLRWQLSLVCADIVTVLLAVVATYGLYLALGVGRRHWDPDLYLRVIASYTALTVFALQAYGAYRDELGLLRIEAIKKILHGVGAGVLLTLGVSFFAKFGEFSRLTLVMFGPMTVFALVAQRFVGWKLQARRRNRETRTR
ncbi:MAG: hypothetical protein OEV00_12835, partial [Acidobacteriota bacterium]|nr:hypothetical protein [Acidobacteriota bacterium]